ncbi:MAG: hypothetical protein ACRERC_19675 [Candidatus Binatia bacterium]
MSAIPRNTPRTLPLARLAFALLAITAIGCGSDDEGGTIVGGAQAQSVQIKNERSETIYLTCSEGITAATGPCALTWGAGCTAQGQGSLGIHASIAGGSSCAVTVDTSTGPSRLCASDSLGDIPDCWQAQWNHVTLLETNFTGSEVFYDISLIPLNFGKPGCFNQQWESDYCNSSGQAAYNLPLSVGCSTDATTYFICQGPLSDKWGADNMFPGNCGDPPQTPADSCVCGQCATACNVVAFFYPMAGLPEGTQTPVRSCALSSQLVATFLAGD